MGERKRILIWGKTRPELSYRYRETVCTGGVLEETGTFVRLYPIPLRMLSDDQQFQKYRWISAVLEKNERDLRPESYRVVINTIRNEELIKSDGKDWEKRRKWIVQPKNIVESVDVLKEEQRITGRSIALLKPKNIFDVRVEKVPEKERSEATQKYNSIVNQMNLPFEEFGETKPNPIWIAEWELKVDFICNGEPEGIKHSFKILDWEADALMARIRKENSGNSEFAAKETAKILKEKFQNLAIDTHFFLGNMVAYPQTFSIVGLWYPKKPRNLQLTLL